MKISALFQRLAFSVQRLVLILVFFLFLISPLSPLISPAFAQTNTASEIPNTPHYSTQSTIIEIMSALTCQLSGIDPINPKQSCLGVDQTTGKIGFIPQEQAKAGGAIGVMGNMISMLYTPPLHTGDYFQNLASNFGIAKPAIAQQTGTGFEGLRPLMGLWTAFRNVVYLVFVIVFVVIGVAIMLRIKIDPRTVMTIQNQIPKIIVGILLVTFSYAIAGFLIDMMYTSIYLVGNIITSSDSKMDQSIINKVATAPNPFAATSRSVGLNVAVEPAESIGGVIKDQLIDNPYGRVITGIIGGILAWQSTNISNTITNSVTNAINDPLGQKSISKIFNKTIIPLIKLAKKVPIPAISLPAEIIGIATGSLIKGAIGFGTGFLFGDDILGFAVTLVIFLVLFIAMLVALFRLWFTLLMAYIQILIDVVFAPFWIIGGIIPGSPISITGWLKDIGANLAVFPVVIAMFLLGKVFQDAIGDGGVNNFVPPLIGDRISPEAIKGFISLGIVLITPNILNVIKTAIKAPKVDTGLGKIIGAGAGAVGGTAKKTVGALSTAIMGDPYDTKVKGFGAIFRGWQRRNG